MSCIVHMGLMKTGTTFLQQDFFPRLSLNYIQTYDDFRKPLLSNVTLFSSEALGGSIYHKRDPEGMFKSFKQSILHLKNCSRELKLIICFREPKAFLISSYKQYLHEGGYLSFEKFYSPYGNAKVIESDLKFAKYIDFLLNHFERNDLFLYNYDSFKYAPEKVLIALMKFMEIELNSALVRDVLLQRKKSNGSVPDFYVPLLIALNKIDNSMRKLLGFGIRVKLFGVLFNPRVICQHILPKIYSGRGTVYDYNLDNNKHLEDWKETVKSFNI